MVTIKSLAAAAMTLLARLLGSRRQDSEEFTLMLPPEAPEAVPGAVVKIRTVAEDGQSLEGDFVVVRSSGAWLTVRHCN